MHIHIHHVISPLSFFVPLLGWWLIQFRNKSGWVPAAYLQKCCKTENGDDTADDEDSSNYLGFVVEEGEKK